MTKSSFSSCYLIVSLRRRAVSWRLMVLASLCLGGLAAKVQAAQAFPLHTSGQFIVDSNGARVHINAFNWYGAEGQDYVVEGLQAQPLSSIVGTIKGMGFNAVRLLWSNQMVESNPPVGSYALTANPGLEGENALTIFDQVIQALANAGIMVILDNHVSTAGWCCSLTDGNELWYNGSYPESSWIADWQMLAQRYESNPWVIGADLRNEPRSPATWGGSSTTDWHAAAERGGNAVLSVNPSMLIFVEGVNYAGDLSGVASLPVQLNLANRLVYEAHDYGFWYSGFSSYSAYVNKITPKWGYLVTGSNPQPLWIGEFGTCDSANTCVDSTYSSDLGNWLDSMSAYVRDYGIDWSYWAINGTTETGNAGGFNTVEGYGVLNSTWNGSALNALTARLQSMMVSAGAGVSLVPAGGTGTVITPGRSSSTTLTIVPANGFTGTVNLSCTVSGPTGAIDLPQCGVPASETISGPGAVSATVSITTTGTTAKNVPGRWLPGAGGVAAAGFLILLGNVRRWRQSLLSLLVIVAIPFALQGCGGSNGTGTTTPSSPSTTAGNYAVTVTASATGISSVSEQIPFTVQ
ncbi:MAG: glycoside hydrolase family 5 protein [Terracidiphilus sp.]|nr:glycoside hydrolase family 5 protein [Terracidiphilus sp.]MDR3798871.1 glycoside hydrolase family 5 protein [Terracidiphilus sp.]